MKDELAQANLYNHIDKDLNSTPNDSYSIINSAIMKALNNHFSTKLVKYRKHKHKKNSWITQGIIYSITTRDRLYKELKKTPCDSSEHASRLIDFNT